MKDMKSDYITLLSAAALLLAASCSDKAASVDLFNGEDLGNWGFVVENDAVPAEEVFSVEDGMISISGTPFGYMYTLDEYSNYELEAEWRWVGEATNSGVFLLVSELSNPFPNAVECNLMAGNAGDFVLLGGAMVDEYQMPEDGVLPRFPKIVKKEASSENPTGEWNTVKAVVCDGNIKVYVNGVFQNEGTSQCKSGHIGLQSEGGPVQFRSVKLTEIR